MTTLPDPRLIHIVSNRQRVEQVTVMLASVDPAWRIRSAGHGDLFWPRRAYFLYALDSHGRAGALVPPIRVTGTAEGALEPSLADSRDVTYRNAGEMPGWLANLSVWAQGRGVE